MANNYALAAGHNNAAGLTLVQDIRVLGRPLRSRVAGLGEFTEGAEHVNLDGLVEDEGYAAWTWTSATLLPNELKYLKDTYLAGQRSGRVTARTRRNDGTYAIYNAILTFPRTLTRTDGEYYTDVAWSFSRGEVLP